MKAFYNNIYVEEVLSHALSRYCVSLLALCAYLGGSFGMEQNMNGAMHHVMMTFNECDYNNFIIFNKLIFMCVCLDEAKTRLFYRLQLLRGVGRAAVSQIMNRLS